MLMYTHFYYVFTRGNLCLDYFSWILLFLNITCYRKKIVYKALYNFLDYLYCMLAKKFTSSAHLVVLCRSGELFVFITLK